MTVRTTGSSKVWERTSGTVVHDDQLGDADDTTASEAVQGGSIVIHTKEQHR